MSKLTFVLIVFAIAMLFPGRSVSAQCKNSLDAESLDKLRITMSAGDIDWEAGRIGPVEIGVAEGCHFYQKVKTCVSWSVSPEKGVSIDTRGILSVGKDTPHNSVFTVTANVEGRKEVSARIRVYSKAVNPLAGGWRQEAPLSANGMENIGELKFRPDGTFTVTWMPFECYNDYWGEYVLNKEKEELKLTVQGGNYVPSNIVGEGTFKLTDISHLSLTGICLGKSRDAKAGDGCNLSFKRTY